MNIKPKLVCVLLVLMSSACDSSSTPEVGKAPASTPPPAMTEIEIDGVADDWIDRPALPEDPIGDSEEGYLDFTTGYAFVNDDSIYLLLNFADPEASFVQIEFETRIGDQRQTLFWDLSGQYDGQYPLSSFALGSAFEARIDLRDLGSPDQVHIPQIRVRAGKCCEEPAWHVADEWNLALGVIEAVNEFDSPGLVASSRPRLDEPSGALPVATLASAPQITIDGLGEDWANIPTLASDPSGDQVPFSAELAAADLSEVRAFRNDEHLYILVGLHEEGFIGHIIFRIAGEDSIGLQLNVFPEELVQYEREPGEPFVQIPFQSIREDVLEIKISLEELGIAPVEFHSIGTCCSEQGLQMDQLDGGAIAFSPGAELSERSLPERSGRPVHFKIEDSALKGDYLYRSSIQLPWGIEAGPDDHLYVADWGGYHIVRLASDGTLSDLGFWRDPTRFTASGPLDIAFDAQGNLYFADLSFVYRALDDGSVERVYGVTDGAEAIDFGPDGALYYCSADKVYRLEIGGVAEPLAQLDIPRGIAVGNDGMIYVNRWPAGDIVRIDPKTGETDDFQLDVCNFDPCFLTIDPEGDIWVRGIFVMRQFSPDGSEKPYTILANGQTIPGSEYDWHSSAGISSDSQGNIWVSSYGSWVQKLRLINPGDATPVFELLPVELGYEPSDLDVGPNGAVYATNISGRYLLRVDPDGKAIPIVEHGSAAREVVAVNVDGVVYYSAFEEILRLEADGTSTHYAWIRVERMVFGDDGYLYATKVGQDDERSIVRISGVDQVETVATDINGDPFGDREVFLMRGGGSDLLVLIQASGNLYRMNPNGGAVLIGQVGDPMVAAASPTTGVVYFVTNSPFPYNLKSVDLEGNIRILGYFFVGDPWGIVVSPDGKYLYIAESGAIDRIYLGE